MYIYLPIAEVSMNIFAIVGLGGMVGFLSGLFGVGGGFLMTPFLIFLGIPPAYAVPNEANNILGTSISGSTTHYLKGTLDYKMGLMIVVGGGAGTLLGILAAKISVAHTYILAYRPWHFLYFTPLPQGHGAFLPTFLLSTAEIAPCCRSKWTERPERAIRAASS